MRLDANPPKEKLMKISDELYRIGAIRDAKSLETIIDRLEDWQNKGNPVFF